MAKVEPLLENIYDFVVYEVAMLFINDKEDTMKYIKMCRINAKDYYPLLVLKLVAIFHENFWFYGSTIATITFLWNTNVVVKIQSVSQLRVKHFAMLEVSSSNTANFKLIITCDKHLLIQLTSSLLSHVIVIL